MKIHKKLTFFLFIMLFCATYASASVKEGGVFSINPSVRAASMKFAATANTQNDVFGFYSNPAFRSKNTVSGVMFSTAFEDGDNLSEFSYGAFSFVCSEIIWGINAGISAISSFEGNLSKNQDTAYYLNISKSVSILSFGANIKYISSKFYEDSNSDSVTGDLGLLADFGIISLGISGFNLAGNFYDLYGEKVQPYLSAGASLNLFSNNGFSVIVSADALQKNIEDYCYVPRFGAEISYSFFSLRGGYEFDEKSAKKDKFSAGLGINISKVSFDYAYISDYDEINEHKAALSYLFGAPKAKTEKKKEISVRIRDLPLKHKNYLDENKAFKAVLVHIGDLPEAEKEFDAAQYLLVMEQKDNVSVPAAHAFEAKQNYHQPSDYDKDGYDPAKELIDADISVKTVKPSKKSKPDLKIASRIKEDEFDAAKYILENPGTSKVKQHYAEPTKHSKKDFDAALYLLKQN